MSIELNALRPVIWRVNTDPFTIAIRSRLSRFRDFPFLLLVDWVELLSGQFRQGVGLLFLRRKSSGMVRFG